MTTTVRRLAALFALALSASGCGESGPPPATENQLESAKKDREEVIAKEYGQAAFQKSQPKKK
jgi:predicted small lipoprotein YifL